MKNDLRVVVFDASQLWRRPLGLGFSWRVGSTLYRGFAGVDASFGARSWDEALGWLGRVQPERRIAELQYWGHGNWGRALIARRSFDRSVLAPGHALYPGIEALRARLAPGARIRFRTCETLGAQTGHDFAAALSDFTGATVAGHTFEIAFFQSGLRALAPGARPNWSPTEGLLRGTADAPQRSRASHPREPNTITCLTTALPLELALGSAQHLE
ncbi:MAG: hypothetical protein QM756_18795 [Polyangiaceae bacterium]